MTTKPKPSASDIAKVVNSLYQHSTGKKCWRVQDKTTRAYCIEFEEWEELSAKRWFEEKQSSLPFADRELVLVRVHSAADVAMHKAIELIRKMAE